MSHRRGHGRSICNAIDIQNFQLHHGCIGPIFKEFTSLMKIEINREMIEILFGVWVACALERDRELKSLRSFVWGSVANEG